MSHPNDSDPQELTEGRKSEAEGGQRPEGSSSEEPPTEKLPAADDATIVLPAAGGNGAEATTELPAARHDAEDETSELPAADQAIADPTEELPSPSHAEATTELPLAQQGPADETTELPAAQHDAADETTELPAAALGQGSLPETDGSGETDAAQAASPPKRGRLKTVALSLVVLLLLGVVGIFSSELIARHLLAVCAEEAAENVLHTKATTVSYDHNKFLITSLLDHEIPYLTVDAKGGSVDKFDQRGDVQLKEAIKGLDVSAQLQDVHVTKDGGSVGHMTTQVTWTTDGIRQTLANPNLKSPEQTESAITSVNSVKLDQIHNQFSVDVNGKLGPFQARAVITVQPEIDKQHNLQIHIRNIDLPDFHNLAGFDVSAVANSMARPAIEQIAGKVASYPMGLKAKSVQVKADTIVFQFYADDAPLVKGTKCTALRFFE